MSKLSPNTEVILSSDLFDDDPCLENMSALAFAVLDAYMTGYGWLDDPTKKDCRGVAAALRAVADQLQMDKALGDTDADAGVFAAHHAICAHILGIAADLEATQ